MGEWKTIITDGLEERGQAILRSGARVDDRTDISAKELLEIIDQYDAMIVRGRTKVTSTVFGAASHLKVVGRAGVGVDNIDLQAAKEHTVVVVNAPASTTLAVAELALGLMFALARNTARADAGMKQGQWLKKELAGIEISGKTLGVIGMGNIGAAVASRASALGMTILGYDPFMAEDEVRRRSANPCELAFLLANADFISLHVPLTDDTRGLIGEGALASMKDGVRIICAARGGVIDEAALLKALDSGKVGGAALDVFSQEPPGLTPLVVHPNVIATPHIGAQTAEAQARAGEDIAAEVLAALRGDALRWRVI
jgi:D-3-phosphoglycerate dehydrogenase